MLFALEAVLFVHSLSLSHLRSLSLSLSLLFSLSLLLSCIMYNIGFFVSLGMADFLDDKSVVFGYVMTGMDIIRDIERIGTPNTGEMRKEVVIVDCGECTPQWGSELANKVWGGGAGSGH